MKKMSKEVWRRLAVAIAFAAVIGVSMLASFFTGNQPSPQQVCTRKCAALNKVGELVYSGPATSKDFYKQANSVCECR
jgi:hypothetical protein